MLLHQGDGNAEVGPVGEVDVLLFLKYQKPIFSGDVGTVFEGDEIPV